MSVAARAPNRPVERVASLEARRRQLAGPAQVPDVVLWSADPSWGKGVSAALEAAGLTVASSTGAALPPAPDGGPPQVAVFDLGAPPDGPLPPIERVERLLASRPDLVPILVVGEESVDLYRQAMRLRAQSVVRREEPAADLAALVRAARARAGARPPLQAQAQRPAEVWAVFGAKGGTGKTTFAANLAAELAIRKRTAALIDLNVGFGLAHVFLDLEPRREASEILSDVRRLDRELLDGYLLRHSSGLRVLPAPVRPDVADFVTGEHVQRLLEVAGEQFQHIVLDLPPSFAGFGLPGLRRADCVLLLTTPDLAGLASARTSLAGLASARVEASRVRLVVRAGERPRGVKDADVEGALGIKIWGRLPWDPATTTSALNHGVPVVAARAHSRYAAAVSRIVSALEKEAR